MFLISAYPACKERLSRLRGRVVVVLTATELEQVAIGMVHPVGRRHLDRSLPFRFLHLPLLDVELHVPLLLVATAPHFDRKDLVLQRAILETLEVLVHDQDRFAWIGTGPQSLRVASDVGFAPFVWIRNTEQQIVFAPEQDQVGPTIAEHVMQETIRPRPIQPGVVQRRPSGGSEPANSHASDSGSNGCWFFSRSRSSSVSGLPGSRGMLAPAPMAPMPPPSSLPNGFVFSRMGV
uniref:Uncharacterized protein n=1 Tax=Anopheles dirus TaxID=7168 RepID=A0A182NSY0_9DIPT